MKRNPLLLSLCVVLLAAGRAVATDPVYVGYYRGSTNVMPVGLYSFTNLADAAGSATRIGTAPFNVNWQKMAFDGAKYYTFVRSAAVRQGKGLYECNGATSYVLISTNTETGTVYPFTNWYGIAYYDLVFYGLYDGSGLSGPGLYSFTEPADPEATATRLFPAQAFSSTLWKDVAFDGTRWLFVKTAAEGNPGIYQYDPQADTFTLVSGSETYSAWEGLGAYVETPPPPPPPANTALLHKKIYVILLGGQSNALGWGYHQYLYDTAHALAYPQSDIDMYSGGGLAGLVNVLTNLQCGAGNPGEKTAIAGKTAQYPAIFGTAAARDHFGPELGMGRTIRDLIHIPNAKVAVIKYAYSGSNIYSGWWPDGTTNSAADGPRYQAFQTTVRNGLNALQSQYPDYEIEILGMGWVQGESDALDGYAADYQNNLTALIADIRATFEIPNMVFALSKLSPNQRTTVAWDTVRAAQDAVAAADPRVVATETTGTDYPVAADFYEGNLHYLSSALLLIGQDLGNAIMNASGLDSDNDGLPDEWENSYPPGATGLGNTPDADYDGDGLTDLQEYETGTSPVDSADGLSLSIGAGNRVLWSGKKDVRYQMTLSTNLTSWQEFGVPVLLRDSNSPVEIDFSTYLATNNSAFFRLQVR